MLLFNTVLVAQGMSQNATEEAAVTGVINRLFKGMELGDSAMVHSVFYKEITMARVTRDKNNNVVLRSEKSVDGFLKAIGTPHKEVWYEDIWNIKVQIDGDFAQLWCDFAFYRDKTFSHCGVDAFHLIKANGEWKIFHLADTNRKTGCDIPQNIRDRHK